MFFLLLFVFLFIVNCGGRAKYQVVVEQKLEELKVIDYFPRGESVPVFIQYIKVSFSSQVTFNFEIEPPVSGELIYDSSSASIIFKPLFTLEYGKSYRVKVKAKDIFSESSTEVLWEFTTIPQDLSPYSVFVPKCFKDKVLVEVSFPYTSSVYIYSNSVRVKDTVASAGRWGFEISENLKEGQNVIEVEVLPLISGERILFRQSSIKDTIPPDPPKLWKKSRTEFFVEEPSDECGVTGSYLLFLSDSLVGFVPNEFDTYNISFEGGQICVKAIDIVGNISDCSNKVSQGFDYESFKIDGQNPLPKWGKIFFLKDGKLFFSDGIGVFQTGITCDKIFPNLNRILCQQGERVLLINRDLESEVVYSSYVSDVCAFSDVFSDGKDIILPDKVISVPSVKVACLDGIIFGYGEKKLYSDYWSKEITSLHYLGKEIVDYSADISELFPWGTSVGIFFENVDLAQLVYRFTGEQLNSSDDKISLLSLISPAGQVLYVKQYNLKVKKVLAFESIVLFLTKEGKLVADFRPFVGGDTTRNLYSEVSDIGLSDFSGDGVQELFIFFTDGTLRVFSLE